MHKSLRVFFCFFIILSFLSIGTAQDYVGAQTCKTCHSTIYDDVFKSGHPYKLRKIEGAPPTYPEGTSEGVPNPPSGFTWNDITYVIGGYGWKARFMDSEGYILTGDTERQWNLTNEELGLEAHWSGYDPEEAPRKPYTCGGCHTTGWVATGENGPHQDSLPGIYGTWNEPGVTCEACHGPGSDHASSPSKTNISKEENCNSCHIRGDVNQIDAKGGLVKHHEQYEELLASPHSALGCSSCHDPHKGTIYDLGGFLGEDQTCKTCHADKKINIPAMANLECMDCHMPQTAKSAVKISIDYQGGTVLKGDIKSHIFSITTDTTWKFFTDDGKFVRVDDNGKAHQTLENVCMTCHTDENLNWAAQYAGKVHGAGEYAGSSTCKTCHSTIYDDVFKSGHPHKLKKIDGAPPTYPEGTSEGVPNPPSGFTWNDITYVIGGYGWKARFMDSEGYILTGDTERQWNLTNSDLGLDAHWSGYDPQEAPRKPYTCGGCHTTGWVATGESGPHQDGLPGIYGTWSEPGVTCEACHGPAADHASNPTSIKPPKSEACINCHVRGDVTKIDAKGGFTKHHEQNEELLASPHKALECVTCHEPHKGTVYDLGGYKGDDQTCKTCHSDIQIKVTEMAGFSCYSCHMPKTSKSAVGITIDYVGGSVNKGDIKSHIFSITSDTTWQFFTDDGKYVRVDENGEAHQTLANVCMTCHTDETLAWALDNVDAIHKGGTAIASNKTVPTEFALNQNYPNPFNPTTTISFDLPKAANVVLTVYTITGQKVGTLLEQRMPAGKHSIQLDGSDWASGVYVYTLQADNFRQSRKMILTK